MSGLVVLKKEEKNYNNKPTWKQVGFKLNNMKKLIFILLLLFITSCDKKDKVIDIKVVYQDNTEEIIQVVAYTDYVDLRKGDLGCLCRTSNIDRYQVIRSGVKYYEILEE